MALTAYLFQKRRNKRMTWIIATAALIATWLNIKKDKRCFYIWMMTNSFWAIYDFNQAIYAQSFLFTIYFMLAAYGVWKWDQ